MEQYPDHLDPVKLQNKYQFDLNQWRAESTSSGFKGVYFHKHSGRWQAGSSGGCTGLLGYYDTINEAAIVFAHAYTCLKASGAKLGKKTSARSEAPVSKPVVTKPMPKPTSSPKAKRPIRIGQVTNIAIGARVRVRSASRQWERGSVCDLGVKGVCVLYDDGERRWSGLLREGENCVVEAPNLEVFLRKFYDADSPSKQRALESGINDFETVLARKRAALAEQVAANDQGQVSSNANDSTLRTDRNTEREPKSSQCVKPEPIRPPGRGMRRNDLQRVCVKCKQSHRTRTACRQLLGHTAPAWNEVQTDEEEEDEEEEWQDTSVQPQRQPEVQEAKEEKEEREPEFKRIKTSHHRSGSQPDFYNAGTTLSQEVLDFIKPSAQPQHHMTFHHPAYHPPPQHHPSNIMTLQPPIYPYQHLSRSLHM